MSYEPPAPVAQRIEHLTTDQKVGGSNPSGCATIYPSQRTKGSSTELPDSSKYPN
jgi:hypothetical protein